MLPALTLLFVYTVLGIPAAVIGMPWTLVSGDIRMVYRWAMWIMHAGLRAAGIRIEAVVARSARPGEALHLSLQPHLESRSTGAAAAAAGQDGGLRQAIADENSGDWLRDESWVTSSPWIAMAGWRARRTALTFAARVLRPA